MSSFPLAWRGFFHDCLEGAVSGNLRWTRCLPSLPTPASSLPRPLRSVWDGRVALASALAQGGLVFAPASLLPTASRMSPAAKLAQLFSITALRGLMKSLLPASAVTYIAVGCLRRDWPVLMALSARSSRGMLGFAAGRIFEVAWKSALVLLVWSVLDYLFERQHLSSELKMSRQEMKDEYKETEGNPVIKGRIRRLQRQLRRRRMLEDTKRAAVVITNPTEYAIALEYRPDMPAPVVVAKGRNLFAAQIREIARWENIPMVENPAARSRPLPHRRGRTKRSRETLCRDRRNPGRRLSRASPRPRRNRCRRTPLMPALARCCHHRSPPLATHSSSGSSPSRPSAWSSSCWCHCRHSCSTCCWPPALPLPCWCLLSALQILRPAQFSVFPSLLLLLTLFRLSLNLASSRRILLHGNEGAGAAGRVIEAFGQFVVGGNYVVGFVLFIALIAIQYIVVSHGAVRTAEVTARFTLDALPGKQMAIDADLNAGLIDEHQARARREQTAREAEFYGAMDGAARFNQRDSIATILITGINILAGFLIGVFQLDIPFREALKTYTVLTVGDGLVTMIPSLAGFDGRRHGRHPRLLERHPLRRSRHPTALPPPLAANCRRRHGRACLHSRTAEILLSRDRRRRRLARRTSAQTSQRQRRQSHRSPRCPAGSLPAGEKDKKAAKSDSIEDLLKLDELSLEVGYALVNLVDVQQGGQLLARVKALRSSASPCNSASSFRPFISPTTSVSSRANTSSRCAASKSRAGKCSKTRSSPSAPNSPRPRLPEPPLASPPSASPPSGLPCPRVPGPDLRLCRRRPDFRSLHPPRRSHPPACLRIAYPPGNQAPARSTQ